MTSYISINPILEATCCPFRTYNVKASYVSDAIHEHKTVQFRDLIGIHVMRLFLLDFIIHHII